MATKYKHSTGLIARRRGGVRHPITGKRALSGVILGATVTACGGVGAAAFASPASDGTAPLTQADWIPLPEPSRVTYDDTPYDPATMEPPREGDGLAEFEQWVAAGMPGYIADEGGTKGVENKPEESFRDVEGSGTYSPITTHDWSGVADCESGNDWSINTGNGYSGGLQFDPRTWNAYGGQEFAPFAHLATPEEQMVVAERVAFHGYNGLAPQGIGAWPTCGARLDENGPPVVAPGVPSSAGTVRSLNNEARAAAGCAPLDVDWNLVASAQRHAEWMASTGRFEHSELADGVVAENIAHGQQSAQDVTQAWLASPGHRSNMLNCDYTHTGLGWADGYWVQQFSRGETTQPAAAPVSTVQAAIDFALAQQGDPYVWGANGPDAWDCSSLIQNAYAAAGIGIPRTTYGQITAGWSVPLDQLQPGDLIFSNSVGHVAMYIGNGQIIEAQMPGTVVHVLPLDQWLTWSVVDDVRRIV